MSTKGKVSGVGFILAMIFYATAYGQEFPPVAAADAATTQENIAATIDLLANDSDPNNDIDSATVDLDPVSPGIQADRTTPNGMFTVDADGVLTFSPAVNFSGTETISYNVSDTTGRVSNNADITIEVESVNAAPTAAADNASTNEDTEVEISILANDSDADGTLDTSKVDLNTTVSGIQKDRKGLPEGEWKADRGKVKFKPKSNFVGTATLDYTVQDNDGATSNAATITVTVVSTNQAPVAVNDTGGTGLNQAVTVNVVANDTDADGTIDKSKVDLNTVTAGVQNTNTTPQGTFTVNANGIVTYTPAAAFLGTATLSYTVMDNKGAVSNEATITITVSITNQAPVAVNDTGGTTINKAVTVNVVANDTDADGTIDKTKVDLNTTTAGVQNNINTQQGSYTVNANGEVTYTPLALFLGTATLKYTVMDDKGAVSNEATLTITVQMLNIPPTAANDNATTTKNKAVTIKVTENDTDPDGTIDATKVDLNTGTAGVQNSITNAQGTYTVNAAGIVTYSPATGFVGFASIGYTVTDNAGGVSNAAQINITVQDVNAAPVAVNDNGATSQNTAVTVNVVANDTDADGVVDFSKVDLNTATAGIQNSATTPQGGWSVSNIGIVTYTPTNNFTGSATLSYTVPDNSGAVSNAATITIAVQPVNAPVANDDVATTRINQAVQINVVTNDVDNDGTIDASKVDLNTTTGGIQNANSTTEGNWSVTSVGVVTYTPARDFTGSASLKYTVPDNAGTTSNAATITVTVQAPGAPTASDDEATTSVNRSVEIDVVTNDRDAEGKIDPTTVDLNTTTTGVQNTATTAQGSFSVNTEGIVTFTPKQGFFGAATIKYTVKNEQGIVSNAANINIMVEQVPDVAPEIIAFESESDTLRYTPGQPIKLTSDFEAADQDDDSLAIAEIGFASGFYAPGSDQLIFKNAKGITGSFDVQTGVLTLSGRALIKDYNDAVRSVEYNFVGTDEFRDRVKKIYMRVSDGKNFGESKTRSVKVNSSLSDLDIPTAFTPNSDGANDTWRILAPTSISGSEFADAQIMVFDKRGTVVFDANGLGASWDGTFQGKPLPVDSYYYTIELKQQQKRYKGIVAILR